MQKYQCASACLRRYIHISVRMYAVKWSKFHVENTFVCCTGLERHNR